MEWRGYLIFDHLNDGRFAVASIELVELLEDLDASGGDSVDQTNSIGIA